MRFKKIDEVNDVRKKNMSEIYFVLIRKLNW